MHHVTEGKWLPLPFQVNFDRKEEKYRKVCGKDRNILYACMLMWYADVIGGNKLQHSVQLHWMSEMNCMKIPLTAVDLKEKKHE